MVSERSSVSPKRGYCLPKGSGISRSNGSASVPDEERENDQVSAVMLFEQASSLAAADRTRPFYLR
jgi:hypothetical protein